MSAAFRFARGDGFDAVAECRAWRSRDARGLKEMADLLGHLAVVNDHGARVARTDVWSPPDLYMVRIGRVSAIYALRQREDGTAATILLCFCDLAKARDASKCEREARRRLAATGFLENTEYLENGE